mgnify:CR=1 FL=1
MPFRPKPYEKITIDGINYYFTEHPSAPKMVYGQTGRRATVYQLQDDSGSFHALKVFTSAWRDPRNAASARQLHTFADLPGLEVCDRHVLTPKSHGRLIAVYPDFQYAILMAWVTGETWQEVMLSGHPLTLEQSRQLGLSFLNILKQMELANLAHCDLSGPNVLVNFSTMQVALVDVEDLYGPNLTRPEKVGGGSSGYAHKTAPKGLWRADADRFSGAILLAEMLGWNDERVRRIGYGEQYFDPAEVQQNSERYRVLFNVLQEQWGGLVADTFARVWFSEQLEDCPSFHVWENLINPPDPSPELNYVEERITEAEGLLLDDFLEEAVKVLEEVYQLAPLIVAETYSRALITRGSAKERDLDLEGALSDYQNALQVAPEGGLKDELQLIVAEAIKKVPLPNNESQKCSLAKFIDFQKLNKKNLLFMTIIGLLAVVIAYYIGRFSVSLPSSIPSSFPAVLSEKLYFTSNRSGNYDIYRLEDGQPVRVTHSANGGCWDPVISPSGVLYFTSDRNGNREIYYLSGTNVMQVTYAPGYQESWSPFFINNTLYFVSNRSGKNEIWRMVDGKPEQVTLTPGMAVSIMSR